MTTFVQKEGDVYIAVNADLDIVGQGNSVEDALLDLAMIMMGVAEDGVLPSPAEMAQAA